ncbi:MAG: hypothetical protein II351_01170, partial [Clostridia bacterium]|nr:hypothetical protein [Clostridia bacterium]
KKAPFAVATVADLEESDEEAFVDNDDMPVEAHYALFVLDEDANIVSLIIVEPIEGAVQSL